MARVCEICGKRAMSGMNVSHSKRRTKKRFLPNLQFTKIVLSNGSVVRARLCASCLKTQAKVKTAAPV